MIGQDFRAPFSLAGWALQGLVRTLGEEAKKNLFVDFRKKSQEREEKKIRGENTDLLYELIYCKRETEKERARERVETILKFLHTNDI